MLKIIAFLVEVDFWLRAFASPMLVSVVVAALVYSSNKSFSIFILVLGAITSVVFAEYVRRKYGCSNYFSRLISIPDEEETNGNSENDKKEE